MLCCVADPDPPHGIQQEFSAPGGFTEFRRAVGKEAAHHDRRHQRVHRVSRRLSRRQRRDSAPGSGTRCSPPMTAHAAKGMEFKHVFVIRANSTTFPSSYKEKLVEFPSELLDKDSIAPGNTSQLHTQEELRLFYVAATRARDTLMFTARPGTGKDVTPAGFLRPLIKTLGKSEILTVREARAVQVEIFAQEEH